MMSADKYPSIFSCPMAAIVYISNSVYWVRVNLKFELILKCTSEQLSSELLDVHKLFEEQLARQHYRLVLIVMPCTVIYW